MASFCPNIISEYDVLSTCAVLMYCFLTDKGASALGLCAMGNQCSNNLGIPPAKGPSPVGCTDLMMDHTTTVRPGAPLRTRWNGVKHITEIHEIHTGIY